MHIKLHCQFLSVSASSVTVTICEYVYTCQADRGTWPEAAQVTVGQCPITDN